jgi:hypothetical protein
LEFWYGNTYIIWQPWLEADAGERGPHLYCVIHLIREQGCQMVYFHTKNPNLGMYILEDFGMENVGIHILQPFGIVCGHLVYFSRFGMFYQEKSGNPVNENH